MLTFLDQAAKRLGIAICYCWEGQLIAAQFRNKVKGLALELGGA